MDTTEKELKEMIDGLAAPLLAMVNDIYAEEGVKGKAADALHDWMEKGQDWFESALCGDENAAPRAFTRSVVALWCAKSPIIGVMAATQPEAIKALINLAALIYSTGYAEGHDAGMVDAGIENIINPNTPKEEL